MSDIGEGVGQLVWGVPLTTGDIVTKMLTFAALTLVLAVYLRGWRTRSEQRRS